MKASLGAGACAAGVSFFSTGDGVVNSSLGAGACAAGVCFFSTGDGDGVVNSSLGAGACAAGVCFFSTGAGVGDWSGGELIFGGLGGGEETTGGDCDGCGEKIIGDGEG